MSDTKERVHDYTREVEYTGTRKDRVHEVEGSVAKGKIRASISVHMKGRALEEEKEIGLYPSN